ncbi:MAG: tetratricopeptide repeat protein [Candidatus Firestonebacteria bacterium]|nr:tetratricopeptide repeat protein [Candidatus Firestonebacteria bacterium]
MSFSRPGISVVLAVWLLGFPLAGNTAPDTADDVMVQTYRQALAVNSQDVLAQFNLGLAFYKLERYAEAREALDRCLGLNRGDARAHAQVDGPTNQILGIIYFNQVKNDRKAVEYFRKSLKSLPDDADTHYALGLAYLRLKEYPESLAAFDRALACGRRPDADVAYQRGTALAALGKEVEAQAAYLEALKLKPAFPEVLENLALIYHHQEKDDEVIEVLTRLIKLEPGNFNANYLLGLHYYQKKMYAEMVAAYNRAVAVKPDVAEAHYNLGMAYFYSGRYELAVAELKKTVALNPKDAEAYNLLGQAQSAALENFLHQGGTFLAQENYPEALAALRNVLAVDPGNAKAKELMAEAERRIREEFAAHLRRGDKFMQDNRLEAAYGEYDLALRLNPASPEAQEGKHKAGVRIDQILAQRLQQGGAAEQQRDYREAYGQYTAALELKGDYAPAVKALAALRTLLRNESVKQFKLAETATGQEQLNEAAAAYKRILKYCEVTRETQEQERALAGLTKVNALRADLVAQYLSQGKKTYGAGNEAKAKEFFNRVLRLEPQNKTANEFVLKLTGSQSQAKLVDEQIRTLYYSGVDCYVKGKIEEAIQAWEKVAVLDPENQDARINISRAKAKLDAIRKLTDGN